MAYAPLCLYSVVRVQESVVMMHRSQVLYLKDSLSCKLVLFFRVSKGLKTEVFDSINITWHVGKSNLILFEANCNGRGLFFRQTSTAMSRKYKSAWCPIENLVSNAQKRAKVTIEDVEDEDFNSRYANRSARFISGYDLRFIRSRNHGVNKRYHGRKLVVSW